MVSTITILGQAADPVESHEGFRYVIVESCEAFDEKSFFSKIPSLFLQLTSLKNQNL